MNKIVKNLCYTPDDSVRDSNFAGGCTVRGSRMSSDIMNRNISTLSNSKNPCFEQSFKGVSCRKRKVHLETYIGDLEKTWTLNLEMIGQFAKEPSLTAKIEKIKEKYRKCVKLKAEKTEQRTKNFISSQIQQEKRRNLEEKEEQNTIQLNEIRNLSQSKVKSIKMFISKFKEVDEYLVNMLKEGKIRGIERFKGYRIKNFLGQNISLEKQKQRLKEEIDTIAGNVVALAAEREKLKEKEEEILTFRTSRETKEQRLIRELEDKITEKEHLRELLLESLQGKEANNWLSEESENVEFDCEVSIIEG